MESKSPLVAVDPGHGGADPGALSPRTGRRECDLTLEYSEIFARLAKRSEAFDVAQLRHVDVTLALKDRAELANAMGAAAVLSFHMNAFPSPDVRGFEVWTSPGKTKADALATVIFDNLKRIHPGPTRANFDDGDPDKEAQFYILRHTLAPAVLVEFGFITNPQDEAWLDACPNKAESTLCVANAVRAWLEAEGLA